MREFIRQGTRTEKRIVRISRYANARTVEVSRAKAELLAGKESCEAYPSPPTKCLATKRERRDNSVSSSGAAITTVPDTGHSLCRGTGRGGPSRDAREVVRILEQRKRESRRESLQKLGFS